MPNVGTAEKFAKKACAKHAGKYDYSKVAYTKATEKVVIICRKHGEFLQTPQNHLRGQGCPKCAAEAGAARRRGAGNPMKSDAAKAKAKATCISKYGAKTYAESAAGRAKLSDIGSRPGTIAKWQGTCLSKYGAKTWSESDAGREKLSGIMSDPDMQAKIAAGYEAAYGGHYMRTQEAREAQGQEIMKPEHRQAVRDGLVRKYGVPYATMDPDTMQKAYRTKKLNGSFNTSKPEEELYALLCGLFGEDDVKRQYKDPERYPYPCDFYIVSEDLFIELNASWTHGGHWFDKNNQSDVLKLEAWRAKNSPYYRSAAKMWSERDPAKKACAEEHNLNYLVFWDMGLADARAYFGI